MSVSVIIVNYNGVEQTRVAMRSVLRFSPSSEILRKEFAEIQVLSLKENRGFGFGNNRGAERASQKYLFFLNNDTHLTGDTPTVLAHVLQENGNIGACGPKLLNHDGTYQLSFGFDPSLRNEWTVRRMQQRVRRGDTEYASGLEKKIENQNVDWLTGAALMVRKDVFELVKGFDEDFFLYFEDADLCRRIRQRGYVIRYVPGTALVHLLGQSSKSYNQKISQEYRKSQIRYYQKHASAFSLALLRLYLMFRAPKAVLC